jgi:hypothetical protein
MGKSQFKFAADIIIDSCIERGIEYQRSDYYWAYRILFEKFDDKFDIEKFDKYIEKRT